MWENRLPDLYQKLILTNSIQHFQTVYGDISLFRANVPGLKVNNLQRYSKFYNLLLFGIFPISRLFPFLDEVFSHLKKEHTLLKRCGVLYEGWNFNSDNYLFTTDTKQIHVSKFYFPSVQSPALCTTCCQRCGSRRIPLAVPLVLIVRMERSTA